MKDRKNRAKAIPIIICVVFVIVVIVNNSPIIYNLLAEVVTKDKANDYYDKMLVESEKDKLTVYGQIKKINNLIEDKQLYGRFIISQQGTSTASTSSMNDNDIIEINKTFNELSIHHKDKEYFDEYVVFNSLINWYVGNSEIAINTLREHEYKNSEMREIRDLHLATMNIELANMNDALKIIQLYNDKDKKYEDYWEVAYTYYLVMNNNLNEARDKIARQNSEEIKDVKSLLQLNNLKESIGQLQYMRFYHEPSDEELDTKKEKKSLNMPRPKTNNTVKGKVLYDGKPYNNAIIYLNKTSGISSSFGFIYESDITAITNNNGEYLIENVPKGSYYIGIAIPWQRAKEKEIAFNDVKHYPDIVMNNNNQYTKDVNMYSSLKVTTEKLESNKYKLIINHDKLEFDYYKIGLSLIDDSDEPSNYYYYSDRIYSNNNEITIDINEERSKFFTRMSITHNGIIDPKVLLDPLYHTGKYKLWVYGNKEDESVHSISNYGLFSNKPAQTIYIEGKEWTKADSLLLENKYEEAIRQYKNELEESPNDIHLLKTISKMYIEEWDRNDEVSNIDNRKAIQYLLRLKKLVKVNEIENTIADCYYDDKDYENAILYYLKDEGEFNKYRIGNCYLYMNEFNKALEFYNESIGTNSNDDSISKIISLHLLRNNIDEINKYSNKFKNDDFIADYTSVNNDYSKINRETYKEFYKYINQGHINKANQWLKNKEDDLALLYKGIFVTFTHDERKVREEKFMSLYSKVEDKTIIKYMEYIGKSNIGRYAFDRVS